MAELETSTHLLNNSTSKQKFSFPKTSRFGPGQKILYKYSNLVAIAIIKFLVLEPIELPPSVMEEKTWASEMTSLFPQLELTSLEVSSRKMSTKGSVLEWEEMYEYIYQGNGTGRTYEGHKTAQLHPRSRQI